MLYLTCTMISRVDLSHYRVSHAKDWVSVDCATSTIRQLFANNFAKFNFESSDHEIEAFVWIPVGPARYFSQS